MKDCERQYYTVAGGRPFLFYVLYGTFTEMPPMSKSTYWSNGLPSGFELMRYDRPRQRDVLEGFCVGYVWETLQKEDPPLAKDIEQAQTCFVLRGEVEDQPDLNYFRDVIGILTYLADSGGVTVYDPQMFKWWRKDEWRTKVFQDHLAYPRHHVVILFSEDSPGQWFHTRGMRKFGRPDLSLHNVMHDAVPGVIDMYNRFIELQAFGGIIPEGREIRMKGLPEGLTCHHVGALDNPDFNNVHVEIGLQNNQMLGTASPPEI